jgi:drug/metabolite transporter (DMT)-like permease
MGVSRIRFLLSLGVGIVAISFASIFIRLAQGEGVPTLSIAAWRLIAASAVLLPYAWITQRSEIQSLSAQEWRLLVTSGVFLGLHFAAWIASFAYTSVASSVVLVSMGPVFVGIGSWIFLRERPGRRLAVGIVLAAVGSIVISWGDLGQGESRLWGNLLALTGAIMMAGYLMIGRKVRAARSLVTYVALVYGVAMVVVMMIVIGTGQPMLGFSPAAYGWMLALGLVSQIIGHSTLNWALHYLSATYVSLVTLSEPIGSGILAYLLLDERISTSTLLGGFQVLSGIYIASRAELGPGGKHITPSTDPPLISPTNHQTEGGSHG